MKEKHLKVKEEFDLEERKSEIDLRETALRIVDSGSDVANKLKAADAEIEALKSLLKDNDGAIRTLLGKNEALKSLLKDNDDAIRTLLGKNEALEKNGRKDSEIFRVKMEDARKKMTELLIRVRDSESVKEAKESQIRVMEDEHKKKVSVLIQRIKVLEAEICQVKTGRKSDQISRNLNEKKMDQGINDETRKRCRSECESVWSSPRMMCNAFTANAELCMKSICALYRQHKCLAQRKGCFSSREKYKNKGFMPSFEARGMALGRFLTGGDPQGRLKKSIAELQREDPLGLEDCRHIARHHYLVLFEIYSNDLDPLYIP